MTNMILINEAIKLVSDIYEGEGIMENTESIRTKVENWYNNTDITSAEMLASAVMLGDYSKDIKYDDIVRLCENYFYDEEPVRKTGYYAFDDYGISIGEIEDSYRDYFWR